ncbi:hypothetical protein Tco_1563003 [Tanacetum coccineum]
MHNNIMAAGSRDRPPMLATGRYAQWRSRFLRYIDTRPNGDALQKCILKGPYTPTIITTPAVPATEDSPPVPEQTTVETVTNMTPENRAHFESEKEAIHLILTGIGDEIYSTVDACQTAQEMWEAIERLQQVRDTRHKGKEIAKPVYFLSLSPFLRKDTSDPETSSVGIRTMQKKLGILLLKRASHEQELKMTLKKLSERQLQIQQCKVQEVQSSVTSSGDETSSGIVSDEEIDKQKLEAHSSYMAKIQEVSPAESSSTDTPLEQVQNHDENDVFANVRRHSEQPESINDTYVLEKDDSNVIPDSSNICTNDNQVDQNAAECVDERAALANLIANLTLDTEENKTVLKQLKKANASLTQELKECKTNLDESSRALGEATSSRDSSLIALQTKQTELEKYTALNDRTSDYKILQTKLNETLGLLALKDIDIKEGLKTKTYEISVVNQKHDELVKKSLLTRSQFEGQLKEKSKVISDLKVKEGKDIDTMIEMDKQLKFLNEIVYTRNQSIQIIHVLAPKFATYNGRSNFANPKYLKIAQSEKPRLYEIPYDTSDPANRFCPNGEETVTLEKESRSKLDKDKVKPYDYTYQNSLYETFKPPSKTYLDQLESAKKVRKTMWRKTFNRTKPNIAKNVSFLPVSKSISKSRQVYNEMTNNFNHFRTICEQAWSNHTNSAFPNPTAKSMEVLIKTLLMPLSNKTILDSHCFVHELKREMNDDLEYVNSLEKELDELESEKADFSNIYDLLLEECVSKDVTCSYLHSLSHLNANTELQCLYLHKVKECECLAKKLSKQTESVNKEVHNNLLKSFSELEKHSISLELSLQHCKEQMKNNPVCKENASNVFRKEREQYHEIQDLKAQMQDKNMVINELKKLILVTKGKSVETQFDKPSVVRQPNAQRIPKPSVLGKPTPFSNSPEMRSFQTNKSVNKTNASDGLFKPVTQQNLPQKRNQAVRNTNVLKPGMFRIASTTTQTRTPQLPHASRNTNPHMSKSSGVIHTTSVSRPQLKCYQVKDKVVPNNSQVKFQKKEVEDHHRISSISKKTKSVTACNDSSNSRTSNANAVCAECGTCVFNSNHDACVSRYLKDVNARTKKPNVVPISASKPKRKANKSVATPHKKTVASDTTIQKSKSYYKKLYENTNQEWKWWIAKRCPSVYTWTQKPLRTKKIWMPKIRKDDESTSISPTIDIVSRITNVLKISNSLGSNLSNVPSSSNSLADCLVLHQMTSDHNRSELGIQDHGNEQSSSKLVLKVVP